MPDAASGTAPPPLAGIEHRIPGRMRLRVPARRGDAGFFARADAALTGVAGVRGVWTNPRTASILIEHDGNGTALLEAAREQELFVAADPGEATQVQPAPRRAGAAAAEPPASPLNLAAFGLAGAGLLQLARGRVVGSASENLWNAYGLYAVTGKALPSTLLVAFGVFQVARGELLGSATSLFLYAYGARRMARHQAAEGTI